MNLQEQWFNFCIASKGYRFFYYDQEQPKYQLFWRGYSAESILEGKTVITIKERE